MQCDFMHCASVVFSFDNDSTHRIYLKMYVYYIQRYWNI